MSDYAYKKIKLASNQKFFCEYLERHHKGRSNHIGVDFGGWTAHNRIVTALIKKGVLISDKQNKYVLVEGEPLVIADPKFDKPYIKVKKEILNLFNGYSFENHDVQIYLDPRGEVDFLIIMPYDISRLLTLNKRATILNIDDVDYMVARGKSLDEVLNNAVNLTKEFELISENELSDVLHIIFTTSTAKAGEPYSDTGLAFQYYKVMQASHNKNLYMENKDGYLREFKNHKSDKSGVTIPWTEEREASLENLRMKLEAAGDELRKILFSETFVDMIDNNGQLMLENNKG